jgi:ElaB/YqjD/DUF883 family membrane-anchored ribosome-binding protein
MAYDDTINKATEDAASQISRLRDQVETLMRDRVTPAVSDAAGRAQSAMNDAAGMVRDQADAVSGKVRDQPLIAVLVAAGIGFVLGRAMR